MMFRPDARRSGAGTAFGMLELVFHAAVRSVRRTHGNAVIGLLLNIFQTVLLIAIFYLMFTLLGMRGSALRGDFLLYVMSGIFVFMTHTKAMGAVVSADGPTSAMMKHSPMNTIISIASAALGAIYLQILSAGVVLFIYHAAVVPITIDQPVGMMAMMLLAWLSGVAIGMVFKAAMPWQPETIGMMSQVYSRANMIFSGKMFVANTMPGYLMVYFDWNPLFHIIDQLRGFVFLNYTPRYTSIDFALYVTLACVVIGLMGEFYTRKHASVSWGAKR